jgi:4-hydroxy-4-methyl-2-oxoglutarate aldolase
MTSAVDAPAALLGHGAATVHEVAGTDTMLPPAIRPMFPGATVCAPAYPVDCGPGDNLWIHRALYLAPAGSVLVVSCGDAYDYGYWGEILSTAAQECHLAGLVIDGSVRDVAALERLGFPVFARGLCVRGTGKSPRVGTGAGAPITIGGVPVHAGDLVLGDADGIICVPETRIDGLLDAAERRTAQEHDVMAALRAGGRTLDLLGLESEGHHHG